MFLETVLRQAFLRRLVSTAAGRAHVLNLMVHAEEGDEAGVFDRLQELVDDPRMRKTIARHQADEREHARLYRACLARNGVEPGSLPPTLLIIRRVARVAEGGFARGAQTGSAENLRTREDIMDTYALLLAIEERGVQQFPIIGEHFRRIGDHETADTFDRVAKDELRHTKYCQAIGRRYAPDERTWREAVEKHRAIEDRAFKQAGLAGIAHAIESGLVWDGRLARRIAALLTSLDPMRGAVASAPPRVASTAAP
jgi:rubrerythrin